MRYTAVAVFLVHTLIFSSCNNSEKKPPNDKNVLNELILSTNDRQALQKESNSTLKKIDRGQKLSVDDIKKMSKAGLSNSVIINQINATQSEFQLTDAEIADLKKAGVTSSIINRMNQKKKP